MMRSTMPLLLPYTDMGTIGDVSGMGIVEGSPYTVAEEEKTRLAVLCFSIDCIISGGQSGYAKLLHHTPVER